jgi:hypothetical protein
MTHTTTFKLPKRFLQDHENRMCLRDANDEVISIEDVLVKQTKTHYFVALTVEQANELMSDADYYSTEIDELGLQTSAKATIKVLLANGVAPFKRIRFIY